MEDDELDILEDAVEGVKNYMQDDLESAKEIEGGGPDYKYTREDVLDDLEAEGGIGDDDSTFQSAKDIAPKK